MVAKGDPRGKMNDEGNSSREQTLLGGSFDVVSKISSENDISGFFDSTSFHFVQTNM